MNTQIKNVEGHNDKNHDIYLHCKIEQFGGINQFEFLVIRDAVLKVQHQMIKKGKTLDGKELGQAWNKLERSWYKSQVIEGDE